MGNGGFGLYYLMSLVERILADAEKANINIIGGYEQQVKFVFNSRTKKILDHPWSHRSEEATLSQQDFYFRNKEYTIRVRKETDAFDSASRCIVSCKGEAQGGAVKGRPLLQVTFEERYFQAVCRELKEKGFQLNETMPRRERYQFRIWTSKKETDHVEIHQDTYGRNNFSPQGRQFIEVVSLKGEQAISELLKLVNTHWETNLSLDDTDIVNATYLDMHFNQKP